MDLKQIRTFVAVYEEGGFSKAAVRERATQPGMSVQIADLEARMKVTLFERHVRGVTPTLAGRRFYDRCLKILDAVREAEEDLETLSGTVSGTVRVGLPTSLFRGCFARLLVSFTERYPAVDFQAIEGYSNTLAALLTSNEVDVAIVAHVPEESHLTLEPFYSSPLALVSGPSLGLTPFAPLRLKDLPPLKLVLPSRRNKLRRTIDDLLKMNEVPVVQTACVEGLSGMLDFMSLSKWATLLPAVAVLADVREGDLVINPIVEPETRVEFLLARRSSTTLSRPAREFVSLVRNELAQFDREYEAMCGKPFVQRRARARRAPTT
jgi:DNA-binding transcriptional LysR family regulator